LRLYCPRRLSLLLASLLALSALAAGAGESSATPSPRALDDYRHFRITAIDLAGRMPTRAEVAAFERPDFDFDKWIDQELTGPGYVERMTRIYMDLLRLEPNITFSSQPAQLFRQEIQGPDGKPVLVFYRNGQRRAREATDGDFCLSPDETGLIVRSGAAAVGTPKKVSKPLLDRYTTLVKPWWLYKDYLSVNPSQRLGAGWTDVDPDYKLVDGLLTDSDGHPTTEVRVCREEAQTTQAGHVYASGRTKPPDAKNEPKTPGEKRAKYRVKLVDGKIPETTFAGGRLKPAPFDRPYATKHKGELLACDSRSALELATECGCGIGLERCLPNDGPNQGSAFFFPSHAPLGPALPLDSAKQQAQRWFPYWWSREAVHFLDDLFASDRDFREILTGHQTFVNGPLAQFYKSIQRGNCCGPEMAFGMIEETEPLFDPKNVPADLAPQDLGKWELVADRGPHAAGVLTLPMFLEKYASARARGAAIYNAFLCKSFVADDKTQLAPSTEPNLMIRPGCSTCHATLEPLAAYFARVEPGTFVFLPQASFPARTTACKKDKNGRMNGPCTSLYDVAFADDTGALLRSAYGSPAHADATPAGAAEEITRTPEFAACAVERVTSSFLGRPTTVDDAPLLRSLEGEFKNSGYRMRALVRALVHSPAYRSANNSRNLSSPSPSSQGEGGTTAEPK
jgi:hypothetical protein